VNGECIQEEVLRALVEQHAVRECLVAKMHGGLAWGLWIRLGRSGAR
jgi:polygalacturonase